MFDSLFSTATTTDLTSASGSVDVTAFLICIFSSLALGLLLSWVYCFRNRHTKSFAVTLALLPAIVCVVIAMVNGNVGAGVAVAGAFSLVRFRSAPGSARDIAFIFLSMCVGLAAGMGYVGFALLTTVIIGGAYLLYQFVGLGAHGGGGDRTLHITVPEDLDYTGLFDEVLGRYTTYNELVSVKTTNMGSLYKLTYDIGMADLSKSREFIDELRCRNGNLEVAMTQQVSGNEGL